MLALGPRGIRVSGLPELAQFLQGCSGPHAIAKSGRARQLFAEAWCSVRAGNNYLGLCVMEMRAPIEHHSIRAVWRVAFAAVADNEVQVGRYLVASSALRAAPSSWRLAALTFG